MSERCRRFVILQLLAVGALLPLCTYWLPGPEISQAFTFGMLLYVGNALLLAYLVDRLFQMVGTGGGEARPGQTRLVALALAKLALVATGVVLALMVFHLPAIPLVAGAFVGMVSTTVVSLVGDKKMLFSIGDLR